MLNGKCERRGYTQFAIDIFLSVLSVVIDRALDGEYM